MVILYVREEGKDLQITKLNTIHSTKMFNISIGGKKVFNIILFGFLKPDISPTKIRNLKASFS